MLKMFIVGAIYLCSSAEVCTDNLVKAKKFEVHSDPWVAKELCEKWISDTSWKYPLKPGENLQSKCGLMIIKD